MGDKMASLAGLRADRSSIQPAHFSLKPNGRSTPRTELRSISNTVRHLLRIPNVVVELQLDVRLSEARIACATLAFVKTIKIGLRV